ncbi:MAG: RidA family protein [Opitutales bacterium]|nr:RidA family protein [Opitutales bacterium]
MKNPFPTTDSDRHAIWQMLVERDIAAFVAQDWNAVADDFVEAGFMGLDAGRRANPDSWSIAFPSLVEYRAEWLKQAGLFAESHAEADPVAAIHRLTTLRDIEIQGDCAVAHKKFDGVVALKDGGKDRLLWQTLYHCRKVDGRWRISGFTGYLPNPMGAAESTVDKGHPKRLPAGASQHSTAGPYSPVLEIEPAKLVVISGQAALDQEGKVVGETIEEQTKLTLENCFKQLATAGCGPADVFKVNIYMTDLDEWPRLNAVYKAMMPEPQPVRTAVQTGLLFTLKVEIEMWAVRR